MNLKQEGPAVWLPLLLVLIVAAGLRFYGISGFSFSNDELSALLRLQYGDWSQLISDGVIPDYHPAGVQVLLWLWVKLGGMSEAWVRLPFILSGIGAVAITYVLGRRWYGHATGLLAAAMLAVMQFPLLYSRLSRPYATGMFLILVLAWLWDRFLFRQEGEKAPARVVTGIALALAFAACMYDHYFSFLMAAVIGFSGLFLAGKDSRIAFGLTGLGAVLLYVPHFTITLHHFSAEGLSGWLGAPGFYWPLEHWKYIFNGSLLLAVAMGILLIYVLLVKAPNTRVQPRLLVLWWLLPLLTAWLYSILVNPVAQHSILLFAYPFLLLALASVFHRMGDRMAAFISLGILIVGAWHTIEGKEFYIREHFANFREAAGFVRNYQGGIDNGELALALNANSPWYVKFYYPELKEKDPVVTVVDDMDDLRKLRQWMDTTGKEGIVFLSLRPGPLETYYVLKDHFPCLEEKYDQEGYAWGVYRRRHSGACIQEEFAGNLDALRLGFEPSDSLMSGRSPDTTWCGEGRQSLAMQAGDEFSPVLSIPTPSPASVHVSLRVRWIRGIGEPQLVASVVSGEGETLVWRSSRVDVFLDPGGESTVHLLMDIPAGIPPGSLLNAYLWNPGEASLSIDDLEMKIMPYETSP